MVKKKCREETWYYRGSKGEELHQEQISHYANPSFVSAVEKSSKNISRSASTVKRKGRKKGKQKGNLKKS